MDRKGVPYYRCFRGLSLSGFPPIVETVYKSSPLLFISDDLKGLSEEEWLSRASDRIPLQDEKFSPAISSGNGTVHCALYDSETYMESITPLISCRTVQPPLIALASEYKKYSQAPFLIWQIEKECSRIAVCEGSTTQLFDFYAGWDEIRSLNSECATTLALILDVTRQKYPVYLVPTTSEWDLTTLTLPLEMKQVPLPGIQDIDPLFHECYALLQSIPMEIPDLSDSNQIELMDKVTTGYALFQKVLSVCQTMAIASLLLVAFWVGGIGLSEYLGRSKREPLQPILTEIDKLSSAQNSLVEEYSTLSTALRGESQITLLMNEISLLFPEGSWADMIEISDQGDSSGWKVDLVVSASREQLVPTIVGSLEKNRNISMVRLIYSERKRVEGALQTQAKLEFFFNPQKENLHVIAD